MSSKFGCAIMAALLAAVARPVMADDKADCIAASGKAQDLRQQDKLVEAHEQLLLCARDVCPAAISGDCGQWLKDVETALPTATVSAKDALGNDLIDVKVTLDDKPWLASLDGKAHPVNPGPHKIGFETAGVPPVTQEILIREGEKDRAITVTLGEQHKAPPPPQQPAAPLVTSPPAPSAPPAPSGGSWLKPAGAVIGGLGLATIATGSVLGVVAALEWSDAKAMCGASCPPGSASYQSANDARNGAATAADWSTALFVAGGVATVAGVVMFLVAPSSHADSNVRVGVAPSSTGLSLSLSGRF